MIRLILFVLFLIACFSFYRSHWHINRPVEIHLVSAINNQTVLQGCLLQRLFGDVMVRVNDVNCKKGKEGEILVIPERSISHIKINQD